MVPSMKISCPKCQHRHSLRVEFVGRRLTCVRCQHGFKPRIAFTCRRCQHSVAIGLERLGQQIACDQCGYQMLAQIRIPCSACARELKIPIEYIGHRITCRGCEKTFRVNLAEQHITLSPAFPRMDPQSPSVSEGEGRDCDLQPLRLSPDKASGLRFQESRSEAGQLEGRERGLQNVGAVSRESQVDGALEQRKLGDPQLERDLLHRQREFLRACARETDELRVALQVQEGENARLQAEFLAYQARTAEVEKEAAQARQQELAAVQAESDRLREELGQLRQQVEEVSVQSERNSHMAKAYNELRTQRDRLLDEKEAGLRQAEQLRTQASELEGSLREMAATLQTVQAESTKRLEEERTRHAAERQALQIEWQVKSEQQFRETEQQIQEAQAAGQQQQLQADTLADQSAKEREALQKEIDLVRAQSASLRQERDAALRQVDVLSQEHSRLTQGHNEKDTSRREVMQQFQAEISGLKQRLDSARQAEQQYQAEIAGLRQRLGLARENQDATTQRLHELGEQFQAQQIERDEQIKREKDQLRKLAALEQESAFTQAQLAEQREQPIIARNRFDEDYRLLKSKFDQSSEKNALLSQEVVRFTSLVEQLESSRETLVEEVQAQKAELDQQRHTSACLKRDLESARKEAAIDRERLSSLLAGEQARVQSERENGQLRLVALVQEFDQERQVLHDELLGLQHQAAALQLERNTLLGRIADLTQEGAALSQQRDEFEAASREATVRFQTEVTRLSQIWQQTKQRLQELRGELDERQRKDEEYRRNLAVLEQERDATRQEADNSRKRADALRERFAQERQELMEQLEVLRQRLAAQSVEYEATQHAAGPGPTQQPDGANPSGLHVAAPSFEEQAPSRLARLAELARKIEALETEFHQQVAAKGQSRLRRGLGSLGRAFRKWSGASAADEEIEEESQATQQQTRALWTEVMCERERVLRDEAATLRADLERQLVEARIQLRAATQRPEQLDTETTAASAPTTTSV